MTNSFTDDINDNFESVKSEIESIKTNYTPLQVTNAINSTIANIPSKTSDLTNDSGFITGISSANVTAALGFTPYNSTNPNGYITGVNSGDITTALGYTPTTPANVDGQWVDSHLIVYNGNPCTTDTDYSLSNYLPNDNYNYEVLFIGAATTGSTSGNLCRLYIKTDILQQTNAFITTAQTRTSNTNQGRGSVIVPVGTGRIVTIMGFSVDKGTIDLEAIGYRRIGTNS